MHATTVKLHSHANNSKQKSRMYLYIWNATNIRYYEKIQKDNNNNNSYF